MAFAPYCPRRNGAEVLKEHALNRVANNLNASIILVGVLAATLTDAIAGSMLSYVRLDMMGDVSASVDEAAVLDYGYTAAKIAGFVFAAWASSARPLRPLILATMAMTIGCMLITLELPLYALSGVRIIQGLAGGVIVVSAQTLLLFSFPKSSQPLVQVVFALGAVVVPATITPFAQGWGRDAYEWEFVFAAAVPVGLLASVLLTLLPPDTQQRAPVAPFDAYAFTLVAIAAGCATFVLSQGNRWDWSEDSTIRSCTATAILATCILVVWGFRQRRDEWLVRFGAFANPGFSFGFIASFAAGFALLGSSFLIPSFAISVLRMTPTDLGRLLLPSAATFALTLGLTALAVRRLHVSPGVTVPFGIAGFMTSMWLMGSGTSVSGIAELLPAVLLRGASLGFLFLSITLIALAGLTPRFASSGVALFNLGRTIGGLAGVAFLQTLIEHETTQNRAVLAANIVPGRPEVIERLHRASAIFASHGLDAAASGKAAAALLGKELMREATTIAFNTGFASVALFFVFAVPVIIGSKILIGRMLATGK